LLFQKSNKKKKKKEKEKEKEKEKNYCNIFDNSFNINSGNSFSHPL